MTEGLSRLPGKLVCIRKAAIPQSALSRSHRLRGQAPLSLRDISPHCGESPFTQGRLLLYKLESAIIEEQNFMVNKSYYEKLGGFNVKENCMKKILVTGGTTFVSKYVAEYFVNAGYEVFVLNRNSKPQVQGVTLIEADRHNLGDILKATAFDAVADITAYTDKDIIDLVKALGSFEQYIMISSSAVYPEYGVQPFTEESERAENKFWGAYGTNKIAAEKALLERVKDAYIVRPPYLYGPMNNVYREAFVFDCALADRKFYLPKDGSMKLQFFHVKVLCRLMEVIIKDKPEEHILNVGNVETVSIKDWVTKCYKSLGKTPNFVDVYEEIEQKNYFSFYNYEYYLDVSRQRKIYPETISLEDGLKDSAKWYLEHSTEVNKKPYFEYIDENLAED